MLRLRYQGHIDRWKIAIYKYSSETYTEAELPTSFGPRTGTPEQGGLCKTLLEEVEPNCGAK